MSVASLGFAAFVVPVLAGYYALPRRAQNVWLLVASYVFYAVFDWRFPLLLAAVTLGNWLCAFRVRGASGAVYWAAVSADVALVVALRGSGILGHGPIIGLSFFMVQAISFLTDVRSGALARTPGLVDFALYLAYFPRLIAGPIERASTMLPCLAAPRVVDDDALARGAHLIVEGVLRKVVLADSFAALAPDRLFVKPELYPAGVLAWGAVASAMSLYNDFAGYTQIVRGVSCFFGIALTPNFRQPLFSRSFTELWTRWHVSLSRWWRDYIFLPLTRRLLRRSGGRPTATAVVAPAFAAMLASGFWHGGTSGMLLWGALHGMFLSLERLWTLAWRGPARPRPRWVQALQMLSVFVIGTLAMIPFRSTAEIALRYWKLLLRADGWVAPDVRLLLLVALTLSVDAALYQSGDETRFLRWSCPARAAALAAAAVIVFVLSERPPPPFVYQGF